MVEKKLPKVFANKVEKNAGNNEKIFYSTHDDEKNIESISNNTARKSGKNVNQKINDIFNSSDYVYKADVEIKLKDKTLKKRIVGRNSTHLITIENELIPISDVIDIKKTV